MTDLFNHRVQSFDNGGQFRFAFGGEGTGDGQFSSPTGIALDQFGNIYVADEGNRRVQVFDSDGDFLLEFGEPGSGDGEFGIPQWIHIDQRGLVYVSDQGKDRISVFLSVPEPSAGLVAVFGLLNIAVMWRARASRTALTRCHAISSTVPTPGNQCRIK